MFTKVINALRTNWQELLGIPAALLLFWLCGVAITWLSPRAALYDPAVLQGVTVVIVNLLVANSIARFGSQVNVSFFKKPSTSNTNETIWDSDRFWLYVLYFLGYCILAAAF